MPKKHHFIRDGYIHVCASRKLLEQKGAKLQDNINYYRRATGLEATAKNIAYIKTHAMEVLYHIVTKKVQKTSIFGDYAKLVLVQFGTRLRETTQKEYNSDLHRFIQPYFEHRNLEDISHSDLRHWQGVMLEELSKDKVRRVTNIFKRILQEAVYDDIIAHNPFEKVRAVKSNPPVKKEPYTMKEIESIIQHSRGWFRVFFIVSLTTGLRSGEARRLTWEEVRFKEEKLKVFQKKTNSFKTIPMLDLTRTALIEWRMLCPSDIYVFPSTHNKPFTASKNINKYHFKPLLEELHIKYKSLQITRHMFASILISKGMDVAWVSRVMGHADIETTLKYYNLYIGDLDQASKAVQANNIISSVFTDKPKIKEK